MILAIDLGFLEILNSFRFSGAEGTISAESLSSASAGDVLGGRRSRGTSRSSVRSRSSGRSQGRPTAPTSARNKSGRRTRNLSRETRGSNNEEADDFGPLPSEKTKCLLDVLFVSLKDADFRSAERLSAFTMKTTSPRKTFLSGALLSDCNQNLCSRRSLSSNFRLRGIWTKRLVTAFLT